MSETAFGKIWRYKEERYSSMIAQTLLLSKSFRQYIEEAIQKSLPQVKPHLFSISDSSELSITTERMLDNDNRIDILIETDSCLIGIENKKWAELRKDQLEGYSQCLSKLKTNSVLVFLSPSRYPPPVTNIVFCHITYQRIIKWIDDSLKKSPEEFERVYLEQLKGYLEELEVSALTDQEIDSLLHYTPCLGKLRAILKATREKSKSRKIEDSLGNYMLASEQIEGVDDLVLFYGFRFSNNWYYSGELLDENSPECLVYLKYKGKEKSPRIVDSILQKIHDDLLSRHLLNIDKKDDGQFRLAVRKNLKDFKGKDNKDNIVEIENWLSDTKEAVQKAVTNSQDKQATL